MANKKPLRNTEVLRRLVKIKASVEGGDDKQEIIGQIQYLVDNL
jgi:hypothetical protein